MILLTVILVNLLVVVLLVGFTFRYYALLPRPEHCKVADADLPFVSVIVPARNEEHNIRRCLESLARQDYPGFEVVVINDRSTDDTGAILSELAQQYECLKPLEGKTAPPAGWTGKNNALVQAVQKARADWLVFIDADTYHYPQSLRYALYSAISNQAQLASFQPRHELGTFAERLITPALWNSLMWMDPYVEVNSNDHKMAYSIGHFILVQRSTYILVGGHESVCDWIIEDHGLAKLVKGRGLPILMADGRDMFEVRMYTDFSSLWHGWGKMLFAIVNYQTITLVRQVLAIICAYLNPFILLGLLLFTPTQAAAALPLTVLQIGALLAWWWRNSAYYRGWSWYYVLLLPVSGILLAALYLWSAFLVISGAEIDWKGRRYKVTRLKLPESP